MSLRSIAISCLTTLLTLPVLSGCGDEGSAAGSADPRQVPSAYELVQPAKGGRSGSPTTIQLARIVSGKVQAVVSGSACSTFTGLDVEHGQDTVKIQAYLRGAGDDPCTQQIIPLLVDVPLENSLGDRKLIDEATGRAISVVDCAVMADHPLCSY